MCHEVRVFALVITIFTSKKKKKKKKNAHKIQKESSGGVRENNRSETQPKYCI